MAFHYNLFRPPSTSLSRRPCPDDVRSRVARTALDPWNTPPTHILPPAGWRQHSSCS